MTLFDALWYLRTMGGLRLLWIKSFIYYILTLNFMSISWHSGIFETSTWHSLIPSSIYPFIKYLTSTIGFIDSNLMTTQRWCASVVSWIQTGVSITLYLSVKMQSTISWDVLVSLIEQGVPTKSLSSHSLHPLPSLDNILTTLLAQHLHPWNLLSVVKEIFFLPWSLLYYWIWMLEIT